MKKFILSALVFLLVGSYGVIIFTTVHADTLSPTQAATLSQSLQAMKTELLVLQKQAAAQATSAGTSESAPLSIRDVAMAETALQSLTTELGLLNQALTKNPAALTENNRVALKSILGNVSAGLLAMNEAFAANAPMAQVATVPSAPAPMQTNAQSMPEVEAQGQVQPPSAPATGNNIAPETAQISSHVPLNRGWMVTLGVIVLLLVAFFVWRSRTNKKVARKPIKPVAATAPPAPKAVISASLAQKPMETKAVGQRETPRSPMSSVMVPPADSPRS